MNRPSCSVLALTALAIAWATPSAAAELRFSGLGGRVDWVSLGDTPETGPLYDLGNALGLTAFADLGEVTPRISAEARLSYWSLSDQARARTFGGSYVESEWKVSDVVLGARGKFHFEDRSPELSFFAGAGLGIHFVNVTFDANVAGAPDIGGRETHVGLDLGGGASYRIAPTMSLNLEAWYTATKVDQLSIGLGLTFGSPSLDR